MGADLITTVLVAEQGTEFNWKAGRLAIETLTAEELEEAGIEFGYGEWTTPEAIAEIRAEAHDLLNNLEEAIRIVTAGDDRSAYTWDFRGATIYLAGGTSWGDSPSETFDVFSRMYYLPSVLKAVGFNPEGQ